jgi:DNA-binding transcriptional LysR family regulator
MPILTPEELPIHQYHNGPIRWWSKTSLRNYQTMGAKWTKLAYIDRTIGMKRPDGAIQGLALDCWLTEGAESFARQYVMKPDGMSFATKDGKDWKAAHTGKEILSADDWAILADAVEAVRGCCEWPEIEKAMAQHTVRRDQPALGIGLQARPDWMLPAAGKLWDLKKTRDLDRFGAQAIDLGYHLQSAIATWCLSGDGIAIDRSYLVAAEWERGARCRVYEIDHDVLAYADKEMRRVAAEIADRIATGNWTDKQTKPEPLQVPNWILRKMEAA